MKRYLPPVLFFLCAAALAMLAYLSKTTHNAVRVTPEAAVPMAEMEHEHHALIHPLPEKGMPVQPKVPVPHPTTSVNPAAAMNDVELVDHLMPALVSLVLGVAALYVILSKKFEDEALKWAFGTIGTILGFWLKSQ